MSVSVRASIVAVFLPIIGCTSPRHAQLAPRPDAELAGSYRIADVGRLGVDAMRRTRKEAETFCRILCSVSSEGFSDIGARSQYVGEAV